MRRLFPTDLWSVKTTRLWLITLFVFLWFDLLWCMIFSFITLQKPEMWINALLASLVLGIPQIVFRKQWIQATVITLLAMLMESNLLYARTYFNAIPASSYLIAGNLADFTASVIDSLRLPDLGFAVLIAMGWIEAARREEVRKRGATKPFWLLLLLTATASGVMLAGRGGLKNAWRALSVNKYYSCRVPMYTVFGSITHDLLRTNAPLSEKDRAEVNEWLDSRVPLEAIADTRTNIVLILCESLESWPIGLSIQGKEITPFLNSVVRDSTTFYAPHVVSQVGTGRSIDAQLLINAGMLPMMSEIYATDHFTNTYKTISKAARQIHGSRSYILTVDKPHTWNQNAVAKAFGIDTLIANTDWHNDQPVGSKKKLGDRSFARQIVEKMKRGEVWPAGENAFVQVVTYSGHNPFKLPSELNELKLDADTIYTPIARYLTMARFTDGALATLVGYLRTRPDYDRTIVVITGDHEGLVADRREAVRRHSWVNRQQMVPLIILNAPQACRYDAVMGQIDIYPLLLQMLGLTGYDWHGLGTSPLSRDFPGGAISSEGQLVGPAPKSAAALKHLQEARGISDMMIRHDLLAPVNKP